MKATETVSVKDIMNSKAISVSPDTALADAANILMKNGLDGIPVADAQNVLVGILTEYDLLSSGSAMHLPTLQKILKHLEVKDRFETDDSIKKILALTVKDVMNPEPLILQETSTMEDVVAAFRKHHRVNPIPVVDAKKRIVGVVSRADVLKFFRYLPQPSVHDEKDFTAQSKMVVEPLIGEVLLLFQYDYTLVNKLVEAGHDWLQKYQIFFKTIVAAIEESEDFHEALAFVAGKICENMDWVLGEVWVLSNDKKSLALYAAKQKDIKFIDEFVAFSKTITFASGTGLPGRVWASRDIEWVEDASQESPAVFLRTEFAKRVGLHSALGIPVVIRGEVVAVLVFFSTESKPRDEFLIRDVSRLVSELGMFLQKKFAEDNASVLKRGIEFATDAVIISTPEPKIVYVNPAWQKLNGYTLPEALGKNPNIIKSENTPKEVYVKMWDSLLAGSSFVTEDVINKRKDGTEYKEELTISPISKEGKIIFYIGITRDITKRKTEEEARRALISSTTHQLRSPLTAIEWSAEAILGTSAASLTKEQKEYLKGILSAGRTMEELVDMFLNIAKIEAGTFAVSPKPLDIVQVAERIASQFDIQAERKKITFSKHYAENLPQIIADQTVIGIVIQNLLSNAIKYSKEGGTVAFDIDKVDDKIRISVKDAGYGIPKSEQQLIFKKFFRGENIKGKVPEGTGLGLYLVKAAVDQSGGKIWFESEENNGTKFYVELPISKV